jgi:hypothetical protein
MHPMQHLIPAVPVTGETPDQDPDYGRSYRVVEQVALRTGEIQEEVWFDGIRTRADGDVHLTAGGTPVARAAMSDNHADARLVLLDTCQAPTSANPCLMDDGFHAPAAPGQDLCPPCQNRADEIQEEARTPVARADAAEAATELADALRSAGAWARLAAEKLEAGDLAAAENMSKLAAFGVEDTPARIAALMVEAAQ